MNHSVPNPVLLLHGIDDTQTIFHKLTPYLEQQGRVVYGLDLIPNNGSLGLEQLAQQVAEFVEATIEPEQSIDLVGFSMGGIVGRYYVQRLQGIQRVQRLVTIASPHQGTWTAYGRPNPGASQMRPGSAFLMDLNHDVEMLQQIQFTSIWTPLDAMIVPATSSRLPVGQEKTLLVGGHAWMVTDGRVLRAIAAVLAEP